MATLQELERALVNADKAGDMDAARKLSAVISKMRALPQANIPGSEGMVANLPTERPTIGQQAVGAGEAALTMGTAATGGMVGTIAGTAKGLAEQLLSGEFGTPQAQQAVQQSAQRGAQALTYMPRTQAGQEITQTVGKLAGDVLPPVLPMIGQAGQVGQSIKLAAPVAAATAQRVGAPVAQAAQRAGTAAQQAVKAGGELVSVGKTGAFGDASIGAAQTPVMAQRISTAQVMPVPFEGKSGLTAGQASRNFTQLQFEKEVAKRGDLGAPLRERVENQTATFIQNFDAMVDRLEPLATDKRSIGQGVDRALVNRAEVKRREIRKAYQDAEQSGEMQMPVTLAPLASRLQELTPYEGIVPTIGAIKREAVRLGALAPNEDGTFTPQPITIRNSETLRQFVNESTDWMDSRQALFARRINESIDEATEGQGGEAYRSARKLRAQFANEFENVGLTAKLLGTKGKTSERQIALDDVFDKVVISSPVDEMNKLRSTLLRAGPDGKQAWNDMKAEGINYIKEAALSPSQRDAKGNPLLSPDKLQKVVRRLDQDGKLESLYGKKQAQTLRDLADLSTVIYTAPPGAINTSNTASALQVALDSVGTFAATGIPAPALTALREASKYVRDRKTKARIEASLNIEKATDGAQ